MSSHPSCPAVEAEAGEASELRKDVALGVFLLCTVYVWATVAWWVARRNHPVLKRREFALMLVTAIGFTLQFSRVSLVNYIGTENLPCDVYVLMLTFVLPLGAGPIMARLVFVYSKIQLQRQLETYNERELKMNFDAFEEVKGWRKALLVIRIFSRELCFCNRAARIEEMLTVHAEEMEHENESVSVSASGKSSATGPPSRYASRLFYERSVVLRTTSSYKFGVALIGGLCALGVLELVVLMTLPGNPYLKGCYNCQISGPDTLLIGIPLILFLLVCSIFLWATKKDMDPVGILSEMRLILVITFGFLIAVVVNSRFPKEENLDEPWDVLYIISFVLLLIHTVQCPMQVIKTYLSKYVGLSAYDEEYLVRVQSEHDQPQSATSTSEVTLNMVLASSLGRKKLQQYLATEFSLENLYFLQGVNRYRDKYASAQASPQSYLERAQMLYMNFVREGAMLEVNISSTARKQVASRLSQFTAQAMRESATMEERLPPHDLFDRAAAEVETLLRNDSFPRFLNSRYFTAFLRGQSHQSVVPYGSQQSEPKFLEQLSQKSLQFFTDSADATVNAEDDDHNFSILPASEDGNRTRSRNETELSDSAAPDYPDLQIDNLDARSHTSSLSSLSDRE
mmetsp:Transcript_14425/g.25833  ORF Transcript_14425/g.25833 Transcript_14425/m.25833 type:complete len:626 (+) Transcript_14425:109-1986(+)|eukprot:CAMPEP_0184527128 /NCGR_PEP_ID=MMETSP0198_2-20121128/11029_1 /TAXON_ID=1112570 /ORGANISM="Thraustochytrium sp., Strain LLF1b" /LENGTH=625 /DNA_ID=CAMNT_0026918759 /DNA_START=104 /DNA_END=1981 /DNA_ORIENTATION=+